MSTEIITRDTAKDIVVRTAMIRPTEVAAVARARGMSQALPAASLVTENSSVPISSHLTVTTIRTPAVRRVAAWRLDRQVRHLSCKPGRW